MTVADVERELAGLREDAGMRTSVLTHLAWVPPEWERPALDTLAGLAERHPSRTILLLPDPHGEDGIEAEASLRCFTLPGLEGNVCSEVIELRLGGRMTVAPASVVAPLLIADLPVFLRWRGRPPFGDQGFEGLVDLVDRLVVDSTEWPEPSYGELVDRFDRTAVSDIAWARGERWRGVLAGRWPGIAKIRELRVAGPRAAAVLLAGWLRSRLDREVELVHDAADMIEAIDVDGEPVPPPRGPRPDPSDFLSAELDRFGRDAVYEAAARAA